MIKVIKLPDLGEGIETVDISEVQVSAGDTIAVDDILIILESEKATMEIPSEYAGVVRAVHVAAGDTLKPGSPIIDLDVEGRSETEPEQSLETAPVKAPPLSTPPPTHAVLPPGAPVHASPGVRRLARELEIDLSRVPPTGPKGRLLRDDLLNYIKDRMSKGSRPTLPEVDFSAWGPVEETPLTKIRRLTGERMQAAWQTIPHVTQFDRADITVLDELRQSMKTAWAESGVRITLLPFLMKAVALLLKDYPDFNSSLASTGQALILKKYIHLGIAVDTPEGLMVPVIRDVDQKDVAQLSRELMDLSERARAKKLTLDELQGATFTISSLGGIGGTWFSPIVNPPQVAILGVSRASVQPVWDSKEATFIPRTILPFSLSYDHRVIDGAAGARFTAQLATVLSDPETIATWEVNP